MEYPILTPPPCSLGPQGRAEGHGEQEGGQAGEGTPVTSRSRFRRLLALLAGVVMVRAALDYLK